ncbi:hypothetical protein BKA56DRAFT_7232 [Ilyonectria sp. MPI-CAGE-AT-0026]|nr:hypothetical protein BKA56DRAFT_7232 [Ilyonectria sp. MPI-CAGE-AT-0026]
MLPKPPSQDIWCPIPRPFKHRPATRRPLLLLPLTYRPRPRRRAAPLPLTAPRITARIAGGANLQTRRAGCLSSFTTLALWCSHGRAVSVRSLIVREREVLGPYELLTASYGVEDASAGVVASEPCSEGNAYIDGLRRRCWDEEKDHHPDQATTTTSSFTPSSLLSRGLVPICIQLLPLFSLRFLISSPLPLPPAQAWIIYSSTRSVSVSPAFPSAGLGKAIQPTRPANSLPTPVPTSPDLRPTPSESPPAPRSPVSSRSSPKATPPTRRRTIPAAAPASRSSRSVLSAHPASESRTASHRRHRRATTRPALTRCTSPPQL